MISLGPAAKPILQPVIAYVLLTPLITIVCAFKSSVIGAIETCFSFVYMSFSYISSEIINILCLRQTSPIFSNSSLLYTIPVGLLGELITIAFVLSVTAATNCSGVILK